MKDTGILFLGGAKRVSMARLFKKSAAERGMQARIYSYELDRHVPIAVEGDVIIGKRWGDPDVVGHLLSICDEFDIKIVVPFVDGAVAVASRLMAESGGRIFAPVSTAEASTLMFDKVAAARGFEAAGIPVPRTFHVGVDHVCGPLIAKPRFGSASSGILMINDAAGMDVIAGREDEYLIQERFDRRVEYTVDCYVATHTGALKAMVQRRRLEVSGGEVTRTITVDVPEITPIVERTLGEFGLRGAVTVQCIYDCDSRRMCLMEVNPRLGGGAVCSVYAGVDLPGLILDDAAGVGLGADTIPYRVDTQIVRYNSEAVFYD